MLIQDGAPKRDVPQNFHCRRQGLGRTQRRVVLKCEWWVGWWFRWWWIGRRIGSSVVVVVVVGVVAVVPCTPGVISVGSRDVVRIGWVCSWSKYDFTAFGSVTWCRGTWAWVRSMTSRNHRRAASWR